MSEIYKTPVDQANSMNEAKGDYPHSYKQLDVFLKNEQPGEKVWSNPRAYVHHFKPNENYPTHMFRKVSIDDLIKGIDMQTMDSHQDIWSVDGKYDTSLFQYDKDKDTNLNDFIRATRDENNNYKIDDGRHRLIALKNGGFTHVVIPIRKIFSNGNTEYNAMLGDINPKNLPTYIRWINYQVKKGNYDKESAEKLKKLLRS